MNTKGKLYSNCCGAPGGDYEDIGICAKCREHCEYEPEEDDESDQSTLTLEDKQSFVRKLEAMMKEDI